MSGWRRYGFKWSSQNPPTFLAPLPRSGCTAGRRAADLPPPETQVSEWRRAPLCEQEAQGGRGVWRRRQRPGCSVRTSWLLCFLIPSSAEQQGGERPRMRARELLFSHRVESGLRVWVRDVVSLSRNKIKQWKYFPAAHKLGGVGVGGGSLPPITLKTSALMFGREELRLGILAPASGGDWPFVMSQRSMFS